MKRVLLALLALGFVGNAQAQTSCAARLVAPFTPAEATKLCQEFSSAIGQSLIPSATNSFDLGSSTRTWRDLWLGGRVAVNMAQAGQFAIQTAFNNRVLLILRGASGMATNHLETQNSTGTVLSAINQAGELVLNQSGQTIHVQEAAPASACMGVATPNGNTAVTVTTSCAVSGARVFYTRVGAVTNMGTISTTTAPNGTSFQFASTGASDTLASSVVWLIVKESA